MSAVSGRPSSTRAGSSNTSHSRVLAPSRITTAFHSTAGYGTATSRPRTSRRNTARPSTARPRTGVSTLGAENQEIICAVSESRGISPTVGLSFVNLDTAEAVLCQISDSQTYVRTVHKLMVFNPSTILVVSTAATPKSKLFSIIEDTLDDIGCNVVLLDRRYWAETVGFEYIQQLAFADDVEAIRVAVHGNYYAVCCLAAVLKYVELALLKTFPYRSLRIKYEPSEGSMMIDLSTIRSLELVQNLNNHKSKDCLFGLLNHTLTPMGARLLRSNIIQPLTSAETLVTRYEALEELSTKEEIFFAVRSALKPFLDVDRTLTQLVIVPLQPSLNDTEQAINNVLMLKQFVALIRPVHEALTGARCGMLQGIRELCAPDNTASVQLLIDQTLNEDTTYAQKPLDLRNQRTYAVQSGVNGLLDVARQTYKEAMTDALQHITDVSETHGLVMQTKFDNTRHFHLRISLTDLGERALPEIFINVVRKKDTLECQTLDLMKLNQKIADAHTEVLMMSDRSLQVLISDIRTHMSAMFKICEAIAVLDMIASFGQLVTTEDYIRPHIGDTLAIRAGRHPIREKIQSTKFIPNDAYATQQTRFQIITGCNMSGKSTYIRAIALTTVMAQIGCFVPAQYAVIPLRRQLFARVSMDDGVEANVSTFAAEMREAAFILRNIDRHSMAIVDELGRGTSTRDGLAIAIAIAIAEALVQSRALVWFATHFRDLAKILAERSGVVAMHLQVEIGAGDDANAGERVEMLYRLAAGPETEAHYGLKIARLLPLPPDVLQHAEHVARTLEQHAQRRGPTSLAVVQARRRRVILNLKEHLVQARSGAMAGETLTQWLRDLQREFVLRMLALDDEARSAGQGSDGARGSTSQSAETVVDD